MKVLSNLMTSDINQQAFFALVQGGLWETEVRLANLGKLNYSKIFSLAKEQAVVGLVAAGIDHVVDVKIPQEVALSFVGSALQLEQRNLAMNDFIAGLIEKLRDQDVYTLLVKGQGVAQCYERPMWRTCGDIDLLLDKNNYIKAKELLDFVAESSEKETVKNTKRLHQEYQIDGWTIELHGTMHADLTRKMDCVIDDVQKETLENRLIRTWINKGIDVFLPDPNSDVIFVFSHILQHLFLEGIGLRQICDWSRLLWTYKETIDRELLEKRLKSMSLMSEWKVFAALAVKILGMPVESMPLYSKDAKWESKANRVCSFIMDVGNFGHNRDVEWSSPIKRRFSLITHRITDTIRLSLIFPIDAPKFLLNYANDGAKGLIRKYYEII